MLSKFLTKLRFSLEIANTKLPTEKALIKKRLRPLCEIPKMSTYAIGAMINYGVSCMPDDTCFVNVGVWNGFTFFAGIIGNSQKRSIAIDNFTEFGRPREQFLRKFETYRGPNHYFYDMDYIEYFTKIHNEKIGFYIYDAEHSYENQLKGLQVAERFFSKGCIVLVDDTNWDEPRQATLDFIQDSVHKYEILLEKKTFCNGHPTLWNGITIFRRCN
jgi:hypothetical protein